MKKILSLKTKVEAVIAFSVVICLIISSAWAVTVKWGTDDSGQSWAGYTDNMITNSNGKAWTATGDNLQLAIWDLNGSSGTVYLPAANISLDKSIEIGDSQIGISIVGKGRGGYLPGKEAQTTLWKGFNGEAINISFTAINARNSFILKGFGINSSNAYTGGGMYIKNAQWFVIEDISIYQCNGTGINIQSCLVNRLENVLVVGDSSEHYDGDGIRYEDSSGDAQWYYVEVNYNNQSEGHAALRIKSSGLIIQGGHFEGWQAINISGSNDVVINDCEIVFANERCIYSTSTGYVSIKDCTIYGSNFYNEYSGSSSACVFSSTNRMIIDGCQLATSDSTNVEYSLYLTGNNNMVSTCNSDKTMNFTTGTGNMVCGNYIADDLFINGEYNTITNNRIVDDVVIKTHNAMIGNNIAGDVLFTQAGDNYMFGNIQFTTFTYGRGTYNNGSTVTHNLDATPDYVLVTPAWGGVIAAVTARSAATFTLSLVDHAGNEQNGILCYWIAIYGRPN